MKTQHLSTFQKEQYTQYLETQLQKFSTFMLTQKKENQNYRTLAQFINKQAQNIESLTDKIKVLESYQRENFKQCERLQNSNIRNFELENRLRKVESIYFQKNMVKQNHISYSNQDNQSDSVSIFQFQRFQKELTQKIVNLQKEIKNVLNCSNLKEKTRNKQRQSEVTNTNVSQTYSYQTNSIPTEIFVTKKQLRGTQENIYGFFNKKFNKIEKMVKNSLASTQVPIKKPSPAKTKVSDKVPYQEETFGFEKNNDYNDLQYRQHDQSISISDTSYQMKPIQYYSQKSMEGKQKASKNKNKRKRKSVSKESRSRVSDMSVSISKSKEKKQFTPYYEHSTNNKSKSISKSISRNSRSNLSKKSQNQSFSKQKKGNRGKNSIKEEAGQRKLSPSFIDPLKLKNIKEYKRICKKKHF